MTDTSTVRRDVVALLKPLLPRTWKLVPYGTNLDALGTAPVVMLLLDSIVRSPTAPMSQRLVRFNLQVIEPKVDPATREDALDDKLLILLEKIDLLPVPIRFLEAKRGMTPDQTNVAYDISLEVAVDTKPAT